MHGSPEHVFLASFTFFVDDGCSGHIGIGLMTDEFSAFYPHNFNLSIFFFKK